MIFIVCQWTFRGVGASRPFAEKAPPFDHFSSGMADDGSSKPRAPFCLGIRASKIHFISLGLRDGSVESKRKR